MAVHERERLEHLCRWALRPARVMLHCGWLRLPRVDGRELELSCDPPADLVKVWVALATGDDPNPWE